MSGSDSVPEIQAALERGDHAAVIAATDARLARHPGDDAAHELRARALLAAGRVDEAERHAADAVRLDPEEVRYRELLAQVLAAAGAHREAAEEFGRLARNDPRQGEWTLAEAEQRLGAAQPGMSVDAAQRAVRLDPRSGHAQLTLSQALARTGDGQGALRSAGAALRLLGGHPDAREALADARWLTSEDAAAFDDYRALASELHDEPRRRVTTKARTLYRQRAGWLGRALVAIGPLWDLAFRNGWLHV
ncbi:MAG: tetratricopeptide repeat protein [Chloroflexota bacterium]